MTDVTWLLVALPSPLVFIVQLIPFTSVLSEQQMVWCASGGFEMVMGEEVQGLQLLEINMLCEVADGNLCESSLGVRM